MMTEQPYIFLSYRSLEVEFGLKLTTDLKKLGIRIWMDKLEIRPADDWVNALSQGVDNCTAMIALISPEYLKSAYCCRELHRADRLNRVVFPLLVNPIDDLGFPIELERKQFLDFSNWKDESVYQARLNQLVVAIKDRFGDTVHMTSQDTQPTPAIISPIKQTDTQPLTPINNDGLTELDILGDVLNKLRSGDCTERQNAARALRNYATILKGCYSAHILKNLITSLSDEDWTIRLIAIEAIAALGAKDAKSALIPLLKDARQMVRMTAVRAIVLLGTNTDADIILPLLTDKNSMVREAVIQGLGMLGNPKAIPALLPLLSDKEPEMRLYAIEALGKIGDTSVVDALIGCLRVANEKVRWVGIEALQKLGDARAIPALRLCLTDERHPIWDEKRVCDMAVEALMAIGTPEASQAITEWQNKQTSPPK